MLEPSRRVEQIAKILLIDGIQRIQINGPADESQRLGLVSRNVREKPQNMRRFRVIRIGLQDLVAKLLRFRHAPGLKRLTGAVE